MGVRIVRPERKIYHIPGLGIETREALASGAAWWEVAGKTCIAAYQAKGAASYAASKVNLANPGTYDATEGVAPTWDAATGWTFNGTDQYLNTGRQPGLTGTWICQFTDATGGSLWGARTSDYRVNYVIPITNDGGTLKVTYRCGYKDTGAWILVAPELTSGNLAASIGVGGFRNGVLDGILGTPSYPLTISVFLGAINLSGTAGIFFGGTIIAIANYNEGLSAPEVGALATRMASL